MNNKNSKNNDNRSFIEGIYGYLERIETAVNKLQNSQPSENNSMVNNGDNKTLIQEIKTIPSNITELNCKHINNELEGKATITNVNFSTINKDVKDIKAPINIVQSSKEIPNSTGELNQVQIYTSEEDDTMNYKQKQPPSYLFSYMRDVITYLKDIGKIRTSETYTSALNSFSKFRKDEDIALEDIDSDVMVAYEAYLKENGLSSNCSSFYLRNIRAVYNRAVEKGLTVQHFPFKHVYTGVEKTAKRAVSLKVIKQIKDMNLSLDPALDFARDMFLFSFYTRGMSFVDMAYLQKKNLNVGVLSYRRRKTGQLLLIRWEKCMQEIVNKYDTTGTDYLLPILNTKNIIDARKQYLSVGQRINHNLKVISRSLQLSVNITMYVARHTWASIAKAENVPLTIISESLGHESESTTRIYLASLNNNIIDEVNYRILKKLK